jgi:mannose-1-phosphate guanylyltransferase
VAHRLHGLTFIQTAMAEPTLASRAHDTVIDRLWGIVPAGNGGARRLWSALLPCRRRSGVTPLRAAIHRAGDLIPAHRLVAVLARGREHDADGLPGIQRVVQPTYRGSAAEVFLPLSLITRRDPSAIVVLLPADGVGQDEPEFLAAVGRAAETVAVRGDLLLVIGLTPPCPRAPGWIEPGEAIAGLERCGARTVRRFLRRPTFAQVSALQANGGLINTGVVVAQARTLQALGRRRLPDVLETLEPLETASGGPEEHLLCEAIYEGMPYASVAHALCAADEPFGVLPVPRTEARVRPVASA